MITSSNIDHDVHSGNFLIPSVGNLSFLTFKGSRARFQLDVIVVRLTQILWTIQSRDILSKFVKAFSCGTCGHPNILI